MKTRRQILLGLGVAALLTASSLALYYRKQAAHFEHECSRLAASLAGSPARNGAGSQTSRAPSLDGNTESVRTRWPSTEQQPSLTTESAEEDDDLYYDFDDDLDDESNVEEYSEAQVAEEHRSDWWGRLKETQPEAYARLQKLREEAAQRRRMREQRSLHAWEQATDYFGNRDTSGMDQQQLEEYNRLTALLDETWALKQHMQSNLLPHERRLMGASIRTNMLDLASLLENERNRQYRDLAVAMGHSESDADAFVGYINRIISNTSVRIIFPETSTAGGRARRGSGGR